jgi:hypothetical protein
MSDFPEYWTQWFHNFYEKIDKNISISTDSENVAVMIEPRDHPMLTYVIYNFMYFLAPKGWSCRIYGSQKNLQTLLKIKEKLNIQICILSLDNLTEPEYNALLTSPSFYENFNDNVKRLLLFKTDTILLKDNIEEFFKYDFIGAAWCFSPYKGCNGGLSLRNRKKMLEICKSHKCSENEDGFFSYTHENMLNLVPTLEDKNNFSMETILCVDPMGMHRAYGHHKNNEKDMKKLLENAWKRIFNKTENLSYEDILKEIQELGYIDYNSLNKSLKLYPPVFTVHTPRIQLFLNFISDYIKTNSYNNFKYFYTVYDAWREHSEPSDNPNFINATKENLQPCKGFGSANEPGRFIQPYNLKNEFPIFCDKVLAFGRHKNDPYTTMIPDADFISTKGYITLLKEIDEIDKISWHQKINKIFWRGGLHGKGYYAYDKQNPPRCQRKMLCDYKTYKNLDWLDAQPSYNTSKSDFLQYKYMIDVDGEVNSWSALWWKLYSNSVVFKVDSHYEQWYYKDLKEWVHYIPVKSDFIDLEERYQWDLQNEEKCKQININSTEFIKLHSYDYVLKTIKI